MKRYALLLVALVGILLLSTPAFADNPHFTWVKPAIDSDGNLVVLVKEAGLGSYEWAHIDAYADGYAAYACRNNGGKFPRDPKKHTVTGPVSGEANCQAGKAGNVTCAVTISPLTFDQPADPCPAGQYWTLVAVKYENIYAVDVAHGLSMVGTPPFVEKQLYNVRWDPWNP